MELSIISEKLEDIRNYLDVELHPVVSPDRWDVYSALCDMVDDIIALLKLREPRVMSLDLPPEEWQDKVIWLEIKGKKPIPCMFRKFCDRMMFGRYERIMSFDAIGSSKEGGYFLRNYGVTWRCWTSRPTDAQREAAQWI